MATVSVISESCTLRQQKARQSVTGWTRQYFIKEHLKVCRQTAHNWDQLIIEIYIATKGIALSDYLFDPGTGEAILIPGKPWNHHQMWVLMYVKNFMRRKPKPLREELKQYLITHTDSLTHSCFFKEFNKNEAQTIS